MKFKQYDIWLADLNPTVVTEPGKTRPVVIVQTDLLNKFHASTIICPITTNVKTEANILRIHLSKGTTKLKEDCDIMIDQVRAIDNKRLLKKIGTLNHQQIASLKINLGIILDI